MPLDLERCERCRFYLPREIDAERGLCRRFPPTIFLQSAKAGKLLTQTQFPVMLPTGWCGEFAVNSQKPRLDA